MVFDYQSLTLIAKFLVQELSVDVSFLLYHGLYEAVSLDETSGNRCFQPSSNGGGSDEVLLAGSVKSSGTGIPTIPKLQKPISKKKTASRGNSPPSSDKKPASSRRIKPKSQRLRKVANKWTE